MPRVQEGLRAFDELDAAFAHSARPAVVAAAAAGTGDEPAGLRRGRRPRDDAAHPGHPACVAAGPARARREGRGGCGDAAPTLDVGRRGGADPQLDAGTRRQVTWKLDNLGNKGRILRINCQNCVFHLIFIAG